MKKLHKLVVGISVTCLVFLSMVSSCSKSEEMATSWPESTPEDQGMDSELIKEALEQLAEQDNYEIHSLLIIRNGYLVTDAYFYTFSEGVKHNSFSVTKSITGTLVGIGLEKGYIRSIDQPILEFFPQNAVTNHETGKQMMTVQDLLTMQTGFDIISKPEDTLREMIMSDDWVDFTLDLPMKEEPGTYFDYCSPGSHLLSAIIQQATGMSTLDFAFKYLFNPLGISDVGWPSDPQGITHGWSDLHLTPYDMAKIGYLYVNNGCWEGKQIVSEEWVKTSTQAQVDFGEDRGYYGTQEKDYGYGYQWWIMPEYFSAVGHGGQFIIVSPERNLVIVMTGGGGSTDIVSNLVTDYIFPAVTSEESLPADPDGVSSLETLIQSLLLPPEVEPEKVTPLPDIANQISEKVYELDTNPFGLLSISLIFDKPDEASMVITSNGHMTMGDTRYEWLLGLDGIERFSISTFDIPVAGQGAWETDNFFSACVDVIGSYHTWKIGLHFEGEEVICRIQDLGESVLDYPPFIGRMAEGSVAKTETEDSKPAVEFTNSSKVKDPDKPGYWVITVREGPGSDYDLLYFLKPGETAIVVGRNKQGDWLLLEDGGWVATSAGVVVGDIDALHITSTTSPIKR
ncbi:MAG: serine hydrolase [Dehalococcoidales bacterium]|nr:MAG: serine hydrolase [Dehalococcoidales bacterium]